nr:unnamed protein product [Callosobruchus analis]
MDLLWLKVNHSSVRVGIKSISSELAQHYKVSWVTDDRLCFFRNAFNLENANQEEHHSDDVDGMVLVILSEAEDNDFRI